VDSYGNIVTKPYELKEAELMIGMCKMFSCLPAQLHEEDAQLLQYVTICELAGSFEDKETE